MLSIFKIGSKPILFIISFYMVISNLACSDTSHNELRVFKTLDESLINCTKTTRRSTETIYTSLEEKTQDPITSVKAQIWLPRATALQKYTADLWTYLEDLKLQLKKKAGLKKENGKEIFDESDESIVNNFFSKKGVADTLYKKLEEYKKDILSIDIQMDSTFRQTLLLTDESFEQANSDTPDFTKTFFHNIPVVAALATLSKFQNNVTVIENRMILFCHNKIPTLFCDFGENVYSAIVAQNKEYLRAGQEIEITAGAGSFCRSAKPQVTVEGKKVKINEQSLAVYKFKVSSKPGKYFVPVQVEYTDQDGKKQTITKDVKYTVE